MTEEQDKTPGEEEIVQNPLDNTELEDAKKEQIIEEERHKWDAEQQAKKEEEERAAQEHRETEALRAAQAERAERERLEAEAAKKKEQKKKGRKLKVGIVLVIILLIAVGAVLTFHVNASLDPTPGATYPWTVMYEVKFTDGEKINFAGTDIIALTDGSEVFLKVGDDRRKMELNVPQTISTHRAVMSDFGITIVDMNYKVDAVYLGLDGDRLIFHLSISTSQQFPEFVVRMLLPTGVDARPIGTT